MQPMINLRYVHYYTQTTSIFATTGTQNWVTVAAGNVAQFRQLDTSLAASFATGAIRNDEKLDIKSYSSRAELLNRTNIPMWCTAYKIFPRANTDSSVAAATSEVYAPDLAVVNGLTAAGGGAAFTNIGVTPFESKFFTQWWKVARVTRFVIEPGKVKVLKLKKQNFEVQKTLWYDIGAEAIKGVSQYWLVVFRGHMCGTQTSTDVTPGQCYMGFTNIVKYKVRNTQDRLPDLTASYLGGIAFRTTGVQQINQQDTEIEVVASS